MPTPSQGDGAAKFYRPRTPGASPFFKVVTNRFPDFIREYPTRYQKEYGFLRPAIPASVKKFLKCGDLREGFARVRCPECGEEMFVSFSCKQRGVCPSCDQKRALLLGHRLVDEILPSVPHRQWVFTVPKCLRPYFRYNRKLLGSLCRAAYETVKTALDRTVGSGMVVPGMVASIQTFGDLIHPS
jgi:ribosomal protein S27E